MLFYYFRYLVIECEEQENNGNNKDSKVREMYLTVMKMFSEKLSKGNSELKKRRQYLQRQQGFINKLVQLVKVRKEIKKLHFFYDQNYLIFLIIQVFVFFL